MISYYFFICNIKSKPNPPNPTQAAHANPTQPNPPNPAKPTQASLTQPTKRNSTQLTSPKQTQTHPFFCRRGGENALRTPARILAPLMLGTELRVLAGSVGLPHPSLPTKNPPSFLSPETAHKALLRNNSFTYSKFKFLPIFTPALLSL